MIEITYNTEYKKVKFKEIEYGALFAYDNGIFMKLSKADCNSLNHNYNMIRLDTGMLFGFDDEKIVTPSKGKLNVTLCT